MITPAQLRSGGPFSCSRITHPVCNEQADQADVDIIWLAVLRLAAYRPRGVHKIFGFVKKHQPGKIDESRRPKSRRRTAAKCNIRFIWTSSPAFDHHRAGSWGMTEKPLVRTNNMSQKLMKKSTLAVTHEENQAYSAWVDDLLGPVPCN